MKINHLLNCIQNGGLKKESNRFEAVHLTINTEILKGREALETALKQHCEAHQKLSGWLIFESGTAVFEPANFAAALAEYGPVRQGEWRLQADISCELHLLQGEQWQLVTYRETKFENQAEPNALAVLAESITHIGQTHGNSPGDLQYRRYWHHDPDWGFSLLAARFCQFQTPKKSWATQDPSLRRRVS